MPDEPAPTPTPAAATPSPAPEPAPPRVLTADAVTHLLAACNVTDTTPPDMRLTVDGITGPATFDAGQIARHADDIAALLAELPPQFSHGPDTGGGGWTVLYATVDKHGELWGEQSDVQRLLALGIAANKARWTVPRDVWPSLPGGMPYVLVTP